MSFWGHCRCLGTLRLRNVQNLCTITGERNYGVRKDGTETWTFVIEENRVVVTKFVASQLINERLRVCEEELHVQQMCG